MRYETTARDFYYETSASTLSYYITVDGVPIYQGVAVKSPNETNLRINIGRRVSDYLHTSMPDFREFDGVVVPHPEQLREFILYDGDTVELERYRVLYEFGGEWNGDYYNLSFPIDGKADPRQKIFWGSIKEGEEVVVIDTESGSTTGSTTGCCENVPQMTYELPYATTYSNSEIDFYRPSVSGGCEILSFSTDEEAQAAGYPAAGYYLSGYTGSTSTIPIMITERIGGRIETMADGTVRVFPELNGKVRKIVAPYAERLLVEGGFGTDVLNGINADNASYVSVTAYFADDLNPRTYYESLRNLCFYNALEAEIFLGRSLGGYDVYSGNTSPVLESIELPNATYAYIRVIGSTAFNRFFAPKLEGGKLYFGGTSITELSLPSFKRNNLDERKEDPDTGLLISTSGDFSLTNCTGITSADTIFGPDYKAIWGTFYGCTGIETFSSNSVTALAPRYGEFPLGSCDNTGDAGTFEMCTSLREINLPALKIAKERSFAYCQSLTFIHFPNLEELSDYAFLHCENLSEIYLPKLKTLSTFGTFAYCTSLENITVKFNSLTEAGERCCPMFKGCTSLESVTLDGPIDDWYELFGSSNSLKTVVFTNIEQWGGSSTNTNVGTDIPSSVTDVYFPSNLRVIASWEALNFPYNPITAIHYDGTKSAWNSIPKYHSYPQRITVIHCTDGDIIP